MPIPEKLFDFAYCHASNFSLLANLAAEENWGLDNSILSNYLKHLYKRIAHLHEKYEQSGETSPYLRLTGNEPELALAIQRENGYYSARTCLTLDMAYNNARLIARPEAAWIRPQ